MKHRQYLIAFVLVAVFCLMGCGEDSPAKPEISDAPSEDKPAATVGDGRTVEQLMALLNGSRWTWHKNQKAGPQTFIFDDGTYHISDLPNNIGTYQATDGYRIELTGPKGETSEMYVSLAGSHFFLISGTGNKSSKGAVRWGRRITD